MCVEAINAAQIVADLALTAVRIQKTRVQKAEMKIQENQLRTEAKHNEDKAIYERQEGIEESRNRRLKSILNMGEHKTRIAAGNLSLNSQTSSDILNDEEMSGELDALQTMKESEQRADNYMYQADKYYQNAALTSFKAKNAYKTNLMAIGTNLIGSAPDYKKEDKTKNYN